MATRKYLDPDAVVPWLTSTFEGRGLKGLIAGVGEDDCGIIQLGGTIAVLSVDFLNATPIVEQLGLGDERVLGRLAVAATVADLLGSGALPRALLVAVTAPHNYPDRAFKKIMLGARSESNRWHVPVIAGDTKLGNARAVLTCGIGTAKSRGELFLASGAQPGDAIVASGNLGTCAAATCLAAGMKGKGRIPAWARRAIMVPELPMVRSRALANLRIAHGGIDISDGLAADLRRLGEASDVGAVVNPERIPIDRNVLALARRERIPAWSFCLASGGDFQFIATIPREVCNRAERLGFTRIGEITRRRGFWLSGGGKTRSALPEVGHKDRKGQQFAEEIRAIVSEIKRGQRSA
jgi:thiamine-monophosphate kinase